MVRRHKLFLAKPAPPAWVKCYTWEQNPCAMHVGGTSELRESILQLCRTTSVWGLNASACRGKVLPT